MSLWKDLTERLTDPYYNAANMRLFWKCVGRGLWAAIGMFIGAKFL